MPSGLITALAAPIREVAAQVGPGWSDVGDPIASLAEVRDLLADVAAAARTGWSRTADGWTGAGADSAADFMSDAADSADRLAQRIDDMRVGTANAADAVARARSRLRDIIDRFEERAAAIEARLDEPGAAEELRAQARRALNEADAVVDELRAELDGHAAGMAAPPAPAAVSSGAPTAPAGFTAPAGLGTGPASTPTGSGGVPGGAFGGVPPADAELAALPLPDPDQFGDGMAVTLPDGSTVQAPNAVAANAVRYALTQLGVPYVWGGTAPGVGVDCSGLTQWAYHQAGLDLPRLAQEQDLGAAVSQNALRPGDLAVWDGHVAMIVGNGQMIEAGCHKGYTSAMRRAVIYSRVSSDQTGQGRSVESQETECRAVCDREGWPVAEVICDNDIGASRWSGKKRPGYRRLSEVLAHGDVLVTWEASRAQRDLAAYVELRDLCAQRGVLWCYSGRIHDLSNGDDRFTSGLDALLAEREAEQIRDRVLRGKRAAALSGRPAGRPPYGYRRQLNPTTGKTENWVVDEVTGPIVKEIIHRVLAGESLWSIVRDLEAQRIPAPDMQANSAKKWRPQRLRAALMSPSYAGLRTHQGTVIGQGSWEALISVEEHERLVAILTDPARKTTTHRGSEPRHLLSGIARCGVCGAPCKYFGPASSKSAPRYICTEGSHVVRRAHLVEALVTETIVERLSRPDAVALFAESRDDVMTAALAKADTLRSRLASFVEAGARGELSAGSLAAVEARLLPEIEAAEAAAREAIPEPLVAELAGPDARRTWEQFTLSDKRTVIAALCTVVINPASRQRDFNPKDLSVVWR